MRFDVHPNIIRCRDYFEANGTAYPRSFSGCCDYAQHDRGVCSMTGARRMTGLVKGLKPSAELDAPDARLARRGEVPEGFVYRYREGVREIVFVGEIAREDTR